MALLETDAIDFRLKDSVIVILAADGSGRLLDLDGDFIAVNRTAMELVDLAVRDGPRHAVTSIARHYRLSEVEVAEDFRALVELMRTHRLLSGTESRRTVWARGLAGLVSGLVGGLRHSRLPLDLTIWLLLSLARLSFRRLSWAQAIDAWHRHGVASTAFLSRDINTLEVSVTTIAARHPMRPDCKEIAFCCWVLAAWTGSPSSLVLGVSLSPLAGHCWCVRDGRIVSDSVERCRSYREVRRYD
ncbi:lasso peptide biosynthesis B2 protein [Mesorhizobium australicum]|uniref:lasso peptide biosynthesis B2 protein n=1 Tax=Mesorhizobium TaxID=68287 RepID=UPI00333C73EB